MADTPSYPGVYVEEGGPGPRPIEGVATSAAAFVGWTPRGRTGVAGRVTSFAEYQRSFGGLHARSWVGFAVAQFFANGGRDAYVVRLTAPGRGVREPNDPAMVAALLGRDGRGRGLAVLQQVDEFSLLCVPALTDVPAVAALQAFCAERGAFLIADCGAAAGVEGLRTEGPDVRLTGEAAANSAIYFPWLDAADPTQAGRFRAFPPSGFVAGVYARTDATRGVWKAPAGTEANLFGTVRPVVAVGDADGRALNARGVNGIRRFHRTGTVVWGARTLRGADALGSEWKYVNVRRLTLFIERSIDRGLRWVAFEPNGEQLWGRVRADVETFLHGLWRQGAFPGDKAEAAFFVRCDRTTMTQADVESGTLVVLVGVAALRPAEFVNLRFQFTADRPGC